MLEGVLGWGHDEYNDNSILDVILIPLPPSPPKKRKDNFNPFVTKTHSVLTISTPEVQF